MIKANLLVLSFMLVSILATVGCGRPSGDLSETTDDAVVADYEAMLEKQASGQQE